MMSSARQDRLIQFLREDLAIPVAAIALGLKQCATMPTFLPMTLWQDGFLTLDQLAQIFDWLEAG